MIPAPSDSLVKPTPDGHRHPGPDQGIRALGGHSGAARLNAMPHTGQVPRVYHPDHTAHIRNRLKNQALYFFTGAVVALMSAAVFAFIFSLAGETPHRLTVITWVLVLVVAGLSGLGLAITGVEYLVYRRRRADLDAAGAEAIGELHAKLHRLKDE